MKKVVLFTVLAIAFIKADAMSYEQARDQALFLTDKMAYELNLTPEQYDAAYEINLDYLMGITTADDVFGTYWEHRNVDFGYILLDWQYRTFMDCLWFYRPLYWDSGFWHFRIYGRYPHRDWFYFEHRTIVVTYTGGGHCWRTHGRSWYCGRTFGHPDRIGSGGSGMRNNWNGRGHRYTSSLQTNGHRSSNSLSSVRGSERGSFSGSSNHSGSFSKSTDNKHQEINVGKREEIGRTDNTSSSQTNGHRSSNSLSSVRGSERGSFSGSSSTSEVAEPMTRSFSEQRSVVDGKVESNSISSKRVLGSGTYSGSSRSSYSDSSRSSYSGSSRSSYSGSSRSSFSSSHSGGFSGGRSSGSFSSGRSGGSHGGFSGGHSGGGRR
ncbi:MAG: hypothetical protein KBS65_06575 [Prevotella sp.]|nr:hypothetical protein [Candidatus Equicola stercoris]